MDFIGSPAFSPAFSPASLKLFPMKEYRTPTNSNSHIPYPRTTCAPLVSRVKHNNTAANAVHASIKLNPY